MSQERRQEWNGLWLPLRAVRAFEELDVRTLEDLQRLSEFSFGVLPNIGLTTKRAVAQQMYRIGRPLSWDIRFDKSGPPGGRYLTEAYS